MFHDLNVPWKKETSELQHTVAFLDELGYDVIALTHTYTGRLPPDLMPPIPSILPFPVPSRMRILRRCNIFLTDSASNFRIPQLQQNYDLVAARPTDEKTLQSACFSLDVDIISLDLTQKFGTYFKFTMLGHAISKGIKIELCYGPAVLGDAMAKRNLISNATQLIRVSRGRGLIISSEAKSHLAARAPSDIINLASVWGLGTERGKEALSAQARSVVEHARLKRESFKGIVDVIYGGEKPPPAQEQHKDESKAQPKDQKRKARQSLEGTPSSIQSLLYPSLQLQPCIQVPRPAICGYDDNNPFGAVNPIFTVGRSVPILMFPCSGLGSHFSALDPFLVRFHTIRSFLQDHCVPSPGLMGGSYGEEHLKRDFCQSF